MPEAAVLIDPVPTMDAEAEVVHPVGIEMVHRTRPEDAFPRNWVRLGRDRFAVEAVLPHDHPFFAPVGDDLHDPLLVAEAMRQAAMLAFHAGYGIPLGYHFLLTELDYVCHPEHLGVGGEPTEIGLEVFCSDLKWRAGLPAQGRVGWAVHRGEGGAARGGGGARAAHPQRPYTTTAGPTPGDIKFCGR
ncbi:AfsA-related hotdog domain-containing protein, partial [Streptomyces griseus]|uniref:2-oxo-3-(phosphooxy)propyl 3-oxoalkanoate synthase n=1 Tax=Streptomyces griseus TaxID=1911 RepID=UPI0036CBB2E6